LGWKYGVEALKITIIITIKIKFEWFHTSYDNIIVDHEKKFEFIKMDNEIEKNNNYSFFPCGNWPYTMVINYEFYLVGIS
jgi:hypothetical protein